MSSCTFSQTSENRCSACNKYRVFASWKAISSILAVRLFSSSDCLHTPNLQGVFVEFSRTRSLQVTPKTQGVNGLSLRRRNSFITSLSTGEKNVLEYLGGAVCCVRSDTRTAYSVVHDVDSKTRLLAKSAHNTPTDKIFSWSSEKRWGTFHVDRTTVCLELSFSQVF